jgi:hypothetical protein
VHPSSDKIITTIVEYHHDFRSDIKHHRSQQQQQQQQQSVIKRVLRARPIIDWATNLGTDGALCGRKIHLVSSNGNDNVCVSLTLKLFDPVFGSSK